MGGATQPQPQELGNERRSLLIICLSNTKSIFPAVREGTIGYADASDSISPGSVSDVAQKVLLLFPALSVCAAKLYRHAFLFTLVGSVGLASLCTA